MSGQGLIVGVDLGLTGMKVVAFDDTGKPRFQAREASIQDMPKPYWVERDGRDFWELFSRMLRNLVEQVDAAGESLAVIGIGCHGDGAWLIDDNGDQVRPGILSLDSRAIQTAARLNESVGDDLLRVTGQRVGPASPGVVLAWLKENEPESLEKARWFLSAKDFLRGMLTGSFGTDLTEASTAFTDVHTQQYSSEAFSLYGLEELEQKAPPISAPGDIVGGVSRLAHLATGLPEGLPVIAGMHDVDAGAIGAGAVKSGQLAVMAGTWSINEVISDRPVTGDSWFCRAFVEHDTWMNMSISPASSANLEWFVTTLCAAEMDAARRAGLNPYGFIDREVGEVGLDDPVTFLPFLYGNPMGIDASASVSGLRAWHKRGHLLRGIYEGIAFNHRIHCDPLVEAFSVEDIRVVGGVTQSDIWPQLFADTMGKPIQIPVGGEGGALGVAMVAAVGIGRFATLTEASEAMGTTTTTVEPTADGTKLMQERFERFMSLVDTQKPWWAAQAAK